MNRKIFLTEDGSHSIQVTGLQETYHSKHGAIQESQHVFINNGLNTLVQSSISVFEMGFGTGLNALLGYLLCHSKQQFLTYTSIEKYPLSGQETKQLNFPEQLDQDRSFFDRLHKAEWDSPSWIEPDFKLTKIKGDISRLELSGEHDIVFFDAFGPDIQPNLWTTEILNKMHNILRLEGLFVTYSAKGQVRRNLQEVGFSVERLPGPPGKREMIRATKT